MDIAIVIVMVFQFALAFIIGKTGTAKLRKFTPAITFVTSLLAQLAQVWTTAVGTPVAPASSQNAAYMQAGFLGDFGGTFLNVLVNSLVQTFLVTGAHSAPKNVMQGVKMARAK